MQICLDIDSSLQKNFKEIGIEPIEAIKEFFNYIKSFKELPFKTPNDETLNAIHEAENGINMQQISFDELIAEAKNKISKR
ncbi:MAG: hypothetical protein HXX81_02720 [Campylobacterales bacterium]|nr:hypothetical protein [Campylobacterales bacterium]